MSRITHLELKELVAEMFDKFWDFEDRFMIFVFAETVQARTHRRPRINKKWRKRYGFVNLPDIELEIKADMRPIPRKLYGRNIDGIKARFDARRKGRDGEILRIPILPRQSPGAYYAGSTEPIKQNPNRGTPAQSAPFESVDISFQRAATMQFIAVDIWNDEPEFLRQIILENQKKIRTLMIEDAVRKTGRGNRPPTY